MSELRDLYQSMILDHYQKPKNCREMTKSNCRAEGFNPLCGDRVTVFLDVEDGVVKDASFQGTGCAISTAAASLMTEAVKGKAVEDVERMFVRFREMVTGDPGTEAPTLDLGKLAVFAGVREFPMRVKCATLVWHALDSALGNKAEPATTE